MKDDPAMAVHVPGIRLMLAGAEELGPKVSLCTSDFTPLLLKRTLEVSRLSTSIATREELMRLAEAAMDVLSVRRISLGDAAGLWDDPAELLSSSEDRKPVERPSWFLTNRVVTALVVAARTFVEPPVHSTTAIVGARELLHEANHLLNREKVLTGDLEANSVLDSALVRIEGLLDRAGQIVTQRPGTAYALAAEALRVLDELAVAHLNAQRGM